MNRIMKPSKTVLICAVLASMLLAAGTSAAADNSTHPNVIAPAQATTSTITVDGVLKLDSPLATVSFETTGNVTKVNVAPGQAVKKGDVLAELESSTLTLALLQAQESLALKQAQVDGNLAPTEQADIDAANLLLNAAYAAYNALKNGDNSHAIEQALRSWDLAKNSLYSAQIGRDVDCGFSLGHKPSDEESKIARLDKGCKVADINVTQSEMRERTAYQAYLDAQKPATQADLLKAYANIAQAKVTVAQLKQGVSDAQQQVYALQLQQSKLSVERAQRNLSKLKLISPCDCVAQEVTISAGASAGGSITLLDVSQIKFHTTNLTELDVVKLVIGQKVTLRLKSTSAVLTGAVETILPVSSGLTGSTALFTAIIAIDATDATLLPGMTGQAEIQLSN